MEWMECGNIVYCTKDKYIAKKARIAALRGVTVSAETFSFVSKAMIR
jgi:hypothetical protein